VFRTLFSLAGLALTVTITLIGYWQARQFTQNRLRFVDAVHKGIAPVLAGVGAALVLAPVTWLVPFIGTGTALLFGVGVAMGVKAGSREIRKRIGSG